ncbi:cupin-like domain-containing protein [Kordiimonas gwangyangensis]|uniref:cupin-like domain-containing protein n=1 Tax=Kordiimonas gwangyangensis TaxID=288022 RepID=UPI00037AD5CD|nr:cupin-like domain-containing protein [Kordiimonas gwangyangensis]
MASALNIEKQVRVLDVRTSGRVPDEIFTSREPVVLKRLVGDWPLVKAGFEGSEAARRYLLSHYQGATVGASLGAPEADGRVFYNEDLSGPNFSMKRVKLDEIFNELAAHESGERPPLIYVASTTIDTCLPGLRGENALDFGLRDPLASIWIGNRTRIAAHYDMPDNIACVAVGKRRFTLFPPEELENLYVGPLDMTPAGQAVSLVDFHAPDFEKFPKFRQALKAAQVAEMEPGDAIYIPGMWWHHVEALSAFNVLVNYWWRDVPAYMGPPFNALQHAILTIRDLPAHEKKVWQDIFNHYVFENKDENFEHIPAASRGVLAPMDDTIARRIRAFLLNRLNR